MSDPFIPHKECTEASGDCLVLGQCLRSCQFAQRDAQITDLEKRVTWLGAAVKRLTRASA